MGLSKAAKVRAAAGGEPNSTGSTLGAGHLAAATALTTALRLLQRLHAALHKHEAAIVGSDPPEWWSQGVADKPLLSAHVNIRTNDRVILVCS